MPQEPPAPTSPIYCPGSYPYPPRWLPSDHAFLKSFACAHARRKDDDRSPWLECPACANASRRRRNHWAALTVVAALLLLVAWRSCG
jgi:hypothetical protein